MEVGGTVSVVRAAACRSAQNLIVPNGPRCSPIGEAGISFIDARDVGACAAVVLTDPRWDGQTLVLTGPSAVTFRQIAELVSERTGRPVGTREITPADVRRGLRARGMASWEAGHFEEMYKLFRESRSEFVTTDVEKLLGRPAGTLQEHLAADPGLTADWPSGRFAHTGRGLRRRRG